MKLNKLVEKLQKLQQEGHGDEDVIGDCAAMNAVCGANAEVSEGEFPEEWHMPEGFKYVLIR